MYLGNFVIFCLYGIKISRFLQRIIVPILLLRLSNSWSAKAVRSAVGALLIFVGAQRTTAGAHLSIVSAWAPIKSLQIDTNSCQVFIGEFLCFFSLTSTFFLCRNGKYLTLRTDWVPVSPLVRPRPRFPDTPLLAFEHSFELPQRQISLKHAGHTVSLYITNEN